MERLHADSVVQTVTALEAVVLRTFGPHGGQVLFTRDTGQAVLSRGGAHILTVLRLDNPLARMIVDCVSVHSARTGDGSKAFVLLLSALVRMIVRFSSARRLADELLSFSLQRLEHLITASVLPFGQRLTWHGLNSTSSPVQKLLSSFFHTRLGFNNCTFVNGLFCELLSNWTSRDNQPFYSLQFLNDMWPALYTPVTGFPLGYSRLVEGLVIHRDFAFPLSLTPQTPIKAVVLRGHLHPQLLDAGETLEILENGDFFKLSSFAEISLNSVIAYLKDLGVSLLLSSVKQSSAVVALAAQAQIHVVECIDPVEHALFIHLSGAEPVYEHWSIRSEHLVSLEFCKTILLGAHRYVHVGFPEKQTIKPSCLVICGTGEGQTEQYAAAMRDSIRMLLTTWQTPPPPSPTSAKPQNASSSSSQKVPEGYVIAAGGTFEFLLNHALLHNTKPSGHTNIVSRILADSLLHVPQQIYSHHPRHFAQAHSEVLKLIQMREGRPDTVDFRSMSCSSDVGLESVLCKYQLLLAVLQCVSQLFRVDSIISARDGIRTTSGANISSGEDSDDELDQ